MNELKQLALKYEPALHVIASAFLTGALVAYLGHEPLKVVVATGLSSAATSLLALLRGQNRGSNGNSAHSA